MSEPVIELPDRNELFKVWKLFALKVLLENEEMNLDDLPNSLANESRTMYAYMVGQLKTEDEYIEKLMTGGTAKLCRYHARQIGKNQQFCIGVNFLKMMKVQNECIPAIWALVNDVPEGYGAMDRGV